MIDLERTIWRRLEALHSGELPAEDFEQWVYSDPGLEAVVGRDLALEFLALDYRGPGAPQELHALVERAYAKHRPGELVYDRARRVAEEFLAGERDLWRTVALFAGLATRGHEWVPWGFVGIDSELDTIPAPSMWDAWEPAALARVLAENAPYLARYEQDVRGYLASILAMLDARGGAAGPLTEGT